MISILITHQFFEFWMTADGFAIVNGAVDHG